MHGALLILGPPLLVHLVLPVVTGVMAWRARPDTPARAGLRRGGAVLIASALLETFTWLALVGLPMVMVPEVRRIRLPGSLDMTPMDLALILIVSGLLLWWLVRVAGVALVLGGLMGQVRADRAALLAGAGPE
jgi:hypothetical protein